MADALERVKCRWCGRGFERKPGPGRPREFCRRSCRQRDYEARQRAREIGLSESELVMTRADLDEVGDLLFVLEAAIDDVEADLAGKPTKTDYAEAVEWILSAAKPLVERGIQAQT